MPFLFSPRSSALRRPTKTLFSVEPTALYSSLPLFLFFSLFLSLSVCARIPAIHAVYTTEQRLDALARTCSVQREITRMLAIMKTSRRRTSADNYREPTLQPSKGLNVKRYTSGHHYGSFYAPATRGSFSPPPFHLSLSLSFILSLLHRFHRSSPRSLVPLFRSIPLTAPFESMPQLQSRISHGEAPRPTSRPTMHQRLFTDAGSTV